MDMIPYHCDICEMKSVSTASFEGKKETRLEFQEFGRIFQLILFLLLILLMRSYTEYFVESGIGVMGRLTLFVHVPYS